jgi:hypothetical protein
VVETGTHRQLLALRGRYAALWQAQTGGAAAADDSDPGNEAWEPEGVCHA